MANLSQLSDADLMRLYQLQGQETNHAPDNSTIQSSTGASGNMQVEPATQGDPGFGVTPSNGTPQDTAREGHDYYLALQNKYKDPTTAAIAYNWGPGNTDKWLANGANPKDLPDETLKYAHNFATSPAGQKVDSPAAPDLSKMSDEDLKAAYAKQDPNYKAPDAANQRGMAALKSMAPDTTAIGNAVTGLGETAAQMGTGAFGQAAGALHGAADLLTGSSYDQAHADLDKERQAVTYDPRTQAGQDISKNVGEMFDKYLTNPLEQGGQTVGEAVGLSPETAKQVSEVGTSLFENLGLPGLMHGMAPRGAAAEVKAPGAASALDALNNANAPAAPEPFVGPPRDTTMGPNAGPARPPITVDSTGNATNPLGDPNMAAFMQNAADRQAEAQGNLTPNEGPQVPGNVTNAPVMLASEAGEVGTPEQFAQIQPFRDAAQRQMDAMRQASAEQLDMFNDMDPRRFDQYGPDETPRSLAPDEFNETVQNLAAKDGTRFPLPEDMDAAYSKYLDMVRDDQGGLFDRPSIAENFAKSASDEALSRRVNDHPVVKANQAKVDQLMAQDQSVPGVARASAAAQDVLQKSQDNISKFFQKTADAATPFYAKDGTVHMYTFGYLPEMMKSLGALLKGIHGVVFKTLDRMIPSFKNLDSFGKIAGQGIKDFVNKQATKEWPQQVNEQPRKVLNGVDGLRAGLKDYLPDAEDISPEALKAQMQSVPDISGGKVRDALRNNLLTGQQLQAFSHHPLVKYAVNTVDSAMRRSQQFVRQQLTGKGGLRDMVRAMTPDEQTAIWAHMQMNEGVREFSRNELKNAGFSDKAIDFYAKRQELNKAKLDTLNAGRATAGLAPVDARVAHIAGHFLGDFKRLVKDADGNVKAVIAHNSRAAVNVITKRVMEQLGEGHEAGPIEMRKLSEGTDTDRYTGYMNILNDMADRDPVVDKVMQAYKDYQTNDAQAAMKYRAAFKSKEGVIGAEGRKSWQSATENANEGIKNELKSLEAMNTWSEMQQALAKIKDFQADPEINAPNAKGMVQAYLDNVQRRNQGLAAAFANSFVNGIAETTGLGPTALRHMSSTAKTGLLTMFIGLGKLSHSFVTLIQPLQGIPVVNSLMKAEGTKLGLTQLTAAMKSMGSQAKLLEALGKGGDVADPFVRKALQFAKDNDTLNTSQFQFGNLTDINRNRLADTFHKAAEFNVTGMETGTRAFTYMYYSHMLKDLGLPEKEIFPAAHNAMKDVMVDYNSWERPGVFGKLGFLGDLTAMLTRYKFNQIDQFARASKYAAGGQLGPMATIMATSIAAAGVRGIMAYTLANKLVQATTTWAAQNNLMDKPTSIDELLLHALHGKNENLSNALKFGLPSGLGLNLTGSLSHADDIPNDPLGSLLPQGEPLGNMVKSMYDFARDPNKATGKTAIYDMAPNSAKGMLENSMFTDKNGRYTNPHNYETQTNRTPADQTKRTFGFRPLHEANESLTSEVATQQKMNEGSVKQDIVQRVLRDVDSNKGVTPALQKDLKDKYIPKYLANNGDPHDIINAIVQHQGMGQARTALEREQGIPRGGLNSLFNYGRTEKLK